MKKLVPIFLTLICIGSFHTCWALAAIVDQNRPPFAYISEQGVVEGYDVAVLRMLQHEYGWSVQVQAASSGQTAEWVQSGNVDILAGVHPTVDQESALSFTTPYLYDHAVIFVPKDNFHIVSVDGLVGRRVALLSDETVTDALHKQYPGMNIYSYEGMATALQALTNGEVDAVIGSYFSGNYWIHKQNQQHQVKVTGKPIVQLRYSFAVPKQNQQLLDHLNQTLATAQTTGTLKRLQDQYFGEDYFAGDGRASRQQLLEYLRYGAMIFGTVFIVVVALLRYQRKRIAKATKDLRELNGQLTSSYETIIRALLKAVEQRESNTAKHSLQVNHIAMDIGRKMGLSEQQLLHLNWGTLLHDIGKLAISDSVLLKPGPLTDAEYELIKKHPLIGYEILKDAGYLQEASKVVLHHQEKYNGQGYPCGMCGNDIPVLARICAVADAFEAMVATRPYRKGMDYRMAIKEIVRNCGTQFDPQIVDAFLSLDITKYIGRGQLRETS